MVGSLAAGDDAVLGGIGKYVPVAPLSNRTTCGERRRRCVIARDTVPVVQGLESRY